MPPIEIPEPQRSYPGLPAFVAGIVYPLPRFRMKNKPDYILHWLWMLHWVSGVRSGLHSRSFCRNFPNGDSLAPVRPGSYSSDMKWPYLFQGFDDHRRVQGNHKNVLGKLACSRPDTTIEGNWFLEFRPSAQDLDSSQTTMLVKGYIFVLECLKKDPCDPSSTNKSEGFCFHGCLV